MLASAHSPSRGRKAVVDEVLRLTESVCAGKETSMFLLPAAAILGGLVPCYVFVNLPTGPRN